MPTWQWHTTVVVKYLVNMAVPPYKHDILPSNAYCYVICYSESINNAFTAYTVIPSRWHRNYAHVAYNISTNELKKILKELSDLCTGKGSGNCETLVVAQRLLLLVCQRFFLVCFPLPMPMDDWQPNGLVLCRSPVWNYVGFLGLTKSLRNKNKTDSDRGYFTADCALFSLTFTPCGCLVRLSASPTDHGHCLSTQPVIWSASAVITWTESASALKQAPKWCQTYFHVVRT